MPAGFIALPTAIAEASSTENLPVPELLPEKRYATLNSKGGTFLACTDNSEVREFISIACQAGTRVLDIGTAYGLVCLEAVSRGAAIATTDGRPQGEYVANDMDRRHLLVLARWLEENGMEKANVRLLEGEFPAQETASLLEAATFDAILLDNVLHFLPPAAVVESFEQFGRLLKPGGRLFIRTSSHYVGAFRAEVRSLIEQQTIEFLHSPDLQADPTRNLPGLVANRREAIDHSRINEEELRQMGLLTDMPWLTMSVPLAEWLVRRNGLSPVRIEYEPFPTCYPEETWAKWRMDGREHLVIVVEKNEC